MLGSFCFMILSVQDVQIFLASFVLSSFLIDCQCAKKYNYYLHGLGIQMLSDFSPTLDRSSKELQNIIHERDLAMAARAAKVEEKMKTMVCWQD